MNKSIENYLKKINLYKNRCCETKYQNGGIRFEIFLVETCVFYFELTNN